MIADQCEYEMIARRGAKEFPVWRCAREKHDDTNHWIGDLNLAARLGLRDRYAMEGKAARREEKPTVLSSGEIPLESVLKYNKSNGKINTQSTLGKVASILLQAGWDVRAGESWVRKADEEMRFVWLGGATHGKRVYVADGKVYYNDHEVKTKDLEGLVAED